MRDDATACVVSFVLHLAALLAMTLIGFVQVRPGRPLAVTVSTLAVDRAVSDPLPLEIVPNDHSPDATSAVAGPNLQSAPLIEHSLLAVLSASALASGARAPAGDRPGPARQFGSNVELPPNAVQAGSFAAWWIPKVERYGEQVEPGQLPRVGQAYRIHVLMRVPDDRQTLHVSDLSGEVVGTDGYRQVIPDRAWVENERGELVAAVGNHRYLRVRNGVVEVIFKVDAAGRAGVRDAIRIRSKLLQEEQTLALEFTAAGGEAAPR